MVTVTIDFGTHKCNERYEYDAKLACPSCASRTVWVELGGGDYYEGPNHVCTTCGAHFTMPRLEKVTGAWSQVTDQLRDAGKDV